MKKKLFSDELMNTLDDVLTRIVDATDGDGQAKADFIRKAMIDRDAQDSLDEFLRWFPQE